MLTRDPNLKDLFLSFNNIYFDATYVGDCSCGWWTTSFRGTARYKIWDRYRFQNRNWPAVVSFINPMDDQDFPLDSEMWQVQKYDQAEHFPIEGFKDIEDLNVSANVMDLRFDSIKNKILYDVPAQALKN